MQEEMQEEDEIINKKNKYHKKITDYVDLRYNIRENFLLFIAFLIPIIVMFLLFRIKNKKECTGPSREVSNIMFSLMLVSLLLTVAEAIYIYTFNVENVYNQLSYVIDKNLGFNEYLNIKRLDNILPNITFNEGKIAYESNLQSTTFLMFIPILLICVFMVTSLIGCLTLSYREIIGIFINFVILATIFGITFVNLGLFQSDKVNYKDIAESFDPYDNVHRFQTDYSFMQDGITRGIFLSLISFIFLFIGFIYYKK